MAARATNAQGLFFHNNSPAPPKLDRVLPLFSLKGRTAIISGAGGGIGLAVAQGLAEAGANVAIWYNTNKDAIERAKEIENAYGVKCKAYQVDVTVPEAVSTSVDEIVKEFNGRLDVFIANSGIPWKQGPITRADPSHYRKVVSINLDGVFYCAQAAGKVFQRQGIEKTDLNGKKLENYTMGSFITTASMSGHIVNIPQLQTVYNASKAGVIHMTRSLAIEWVKFARVNSVSPGYIDTEISSFVPEKTKNVWKDKIPMGREADAAELKGVYLYLASDASSYTTGADIIVDGGYSLP